MEDDFDISTDNVEFFFAQTKPERAPHVTHRMRVRTQITLTWLCTRGKKQYKYC